MVEFIVIDQEGLVSCRMIAARICVCMCMCVQQRQSLAAEVEQLRAEAKAAAEAVGHAGATTSGLVERLVRDNALNADQQRRHQLIRDSQAIGRILPVRYLHARKLR